jgi:hypothetical protein
MTVKRTGDTFIVELSEHGEASSGSNEPLGFYVDARGGSDSEVPIRIIFYGNNSKAPGGEGEIRYISVKQALSMIMALNGAVKIAMEDADERSVDDR